MRHCRYARRLLAAGIVLLGTGLLLAGPASASSLRPTATAAPSPAQVAELTATDAASGNWFGTAVAVAADGNTALIGAVGRDSSTGAAYVFTRTRAGWQQAAELTASDGVSDDYFGTAVAVAADGNTALISAPGRDGITGAAYVFTRTRAGWQQTAELTASDGARGDWFGNWVAITAHGNTALIGAPYHDSGTGAAYVFTRTRVGWQQTAELTAGDAASYNTFGTSVAISWDGNTALIGAIYRDGGTGAAYVFARTRAGWQQTAELTASDAAGANLFGFSVAITADGNTALISAPDHDSYTGAAYIFTRTLAGWQQTAELTASDAAADNYFGLPLAISAAGNTALIGAVGRDSSTGAAYVFTRTRAGWQQAAELTASYAGSGDYFGDAVAVSAAGNTALIGAVGPGSHSGAAYLFALPPWWW